jgi:hypothetical protein
MGENAVKRRALWQHNRPSDRCSHYHLWLSRMKLRVSECTLQTSSEVSRRAFAQGMKTTAAAGLCNSDFETGTGPWDFTERSVSAVASER